MNCYQFEDNLSFDIETVKNAIKLIIKSNSAQFIYTERDETTYKLESIKCKYLIDLQKIDDDTTFIRITNAAEENEETLKKYATEFFDIINLYIDLDEEDDEEEINAIIDHIDERCEKLENFGIACIITLFFLTLQVTLIACMVAHWH